MKWFMLSKPASLTIWFWDLVDELDEAPVLACFAELELEVCLEDIPVYEQLSVNVELILGLTAMCARVYELSYDKSLQDEKRMGLREGVRMSYTAAIKKTAAQMVAQSVCLR